MKSSPFTLSAGLLVTVLASAPAGAAVITQHSGICDASAAVPAGKAMFAVANDEDNVLRIYQRDEPGGPSLSFPMDAFLKLEDKHPEADIEGATLIGHRIYWITSHGANRNGKPRPNRRRLFATDLRLEGGAVDLVPVGGPYPNLVEDLAKAGDLAPFDLAAAAKKPPEGEGGLNIEGLSRTPEGKLLIGFRNPIPGGKALIVPLENPDEVIEGKSARLGKPILLPLGGLGIRSMEYSEAMGKYLIVAGSHEDRGDFRLYRWSGVAAEAPELVRRVDFRGLRPEALLVYPEEKARLQALSDDGGEIIAGRECKDEAVKIEDKRFRSVWVSP